MAAMSAAREGSVGRREVLGGALAGVAFLLARQRNAFASAGSAEAAIAARLAGRSAERSGRLMLDVPPTFEYGNTVPLGIAVDGAMTPEDHVRRIDIFADGNPLPGVAALHFTPGSPARLSTRFRLDKGDHLVRAFAELSDGTMLTTSCEITAASDGCGGKSGIAPGASEPEPAPRVSLPDHAGRGEIVEVASMIAHRMETGFRTDTAGGLLPRRIISRMECRYGGRLVFAADLSPAIAANAYLKFPIRAEETGEIAFAWYEDGGAVYRAARRIAVD
jgi:thiosulfate oxidation carrier complex protein SoxZ